MGPCRFHKMYHSTNSLIVFFPTLTHITFDRLHSIFIFFFNTFVNAPSRLKYWQSDRPWNVPEDDENPSSAAFRVGLAWTIHFQFILDSRYYFWLLEESQWQNFKKHYGSVRRNNNKRANVFPIDWNHINFSHDDFIQNFDFTRYSIAVSRKSAVRNWDLRE